MVSTAHESTTEIIRVARPTEQRAWRIPKCKINLRPEWIWKRCRENKRYGNREEAKLILTYRFWGCVFTTSPKKTATVEDRGAMADVFIGYRRSDSAGWTRSLSSDLKRK